MGKKRGWISTVKKVLTFDSKNTKEKKSDDLKNKNGISTIEVSLEKTEDEHIMRAYSMAISTAEAAEAAAAAARAAAAEVARLTAAARESERLKEERAAVKIQTVFRAHLARKAVRALRGLTRLKSLIEGRSVQRQSIVTLQCMQTISRMQSQIQSRKVRMSEENLALLHQQLHLKYESQLSDKLKTPAATTVGKDWNASAASKEQIVAKLQNKEEAAKKRERALAYVNSHRQVRKNPAITNETDPFLGWSWLERWVATRPWENKTTQDRHVINDHDNTSQKSNTTHPKPPISTPKTQSLGPKARPMGPKGSGPRRVQSERRHTIGGSSMTMGDNNNMASSIAISRRLPSSIDLSAPPQGQPSVSPNGTTSKEKPKVKASKLGNGKSDKGSFGSDKKRLSNMSYSPGVRRHSGPPKVCSTS